MSLIMSFDSLDIFQVYTEHNQKANYLSKEALVLGPGLCSFSDIEDDSSCMNGNLQLF